MRRAGVRERGRVPAALAAVVAGVALAAGGCAPGDPAPGDPAPGGRTPGARASAPAPAPAHPGVPPAGVVVDYQLGGGYPPAEGVGGVVRDVTDVPAPGLWSGCYVNGFQTQPAERDTWLRDHPDLVLRDAAGEPVADGGWPDELLLDTRTAAARAAVAEVVGAQVRACAARGFGAVELDNLDSWTRSGGLLTEEGALDLAARLVAVAHEVGLAAGQKNAPDLGARGRDEAGFDFAMSEECLAYEECAAYTDVYGAAVLDVEYAGSAPADDWAAACADPLRPPSTVLRDHDLGAPGDAGYVFDAC
ncbi:endo alpha-1,4 polygalactosaminidase [Cellulomonas hominis]|nr:endo alpha-1,4 polygalactosaminidase [Cellulomonas hominis]